MSDVISREEALRRVQQMSFMTDELRLFLDTHPRSNEALSALRRYLAMEDAAKQRYEQSYGPLTLDAVARSCRYSWIDNPWPWEMEA